MNNANLFPVPHKATFGKRLTALMEDKGIKSVKALAKEIFGKFDKYVKSNDEDVDDGTIEIIRKRITSHLNEDHNPNPKMEFIKEYCEFFDCDAGFLLGYIDFPKQKAQDLYDLTGLNDKALDTLETWYKHQKRIENNDIHLPYFFPIEVLNILLANKNDMEFLLNSIQDLLRSEYNIPAYNNGQFGVEIDGKCRLLSPQYVVPDSEWDVIKGGDNGSRDTYLLTLVKDKTKTWDNVQIPLSDDFFESIALMRIEKHLLKIKKDYQYKEGDT